MKKFITDFDIVKLHNFRIHFKYLMCICWYVIEKQAEFTLVMTTQILF